MDLHLEMGSNIESAISYLPLGDTGLVLQQFSLSVPSFLKQV